MNRNTEAHFSEYPKINLRRSKFDLSHSLKTTFNAGDCNIIYCSEILPGDTVQMDLAEMVRMSTPIYPVMDNAYLDTYFFFVPNRLLWEHWEQFWGQNDDPWTQTTQYEIPKISAPTGGWKTGTIADQIGMPIGIEKTIDVLPFRAYCKIWNDYFRDENLKTACHIYLDDTTRTGMNGTETGYNYVTGAELGGAPLKAAKFHGYMTSALPSPQRGPSVTIPLGTKAPVNAWADTHALESTPATGVHWVDTGGNDLTGYYNIGALGNSTAINSTTQPAGIAYATPNNLWANLEDATAATINELRTAFAIQKYYENCGIKGTRYIEWIEGVFGVKSSDARLQRAEYLGGMRSPLNMDQILQTSSTDNTSPQGNTAGFSCTFDKDSLFTKSFEEHGYLMGIAVVRTDRTYQQGVPKFLLRTKWTDFYNPFFANLGEQAITNEQIYAQGDSVLNPSTGKPYDKEVFGYQEAWADYRYAENRTSGYMRSTANGSLDAWHYGDDYNSLPHLGSDWIDEPVDTVDRVLAVGSSLTHQFIGDFFFKTYYTRCMPVYSVPGLIDHV